MEKARTTLVLFVTAFMIYASACASVPLNLSTQGKQAFYGTRVIKTLDLLRDTAVDANAQTPPLLSTAVTREVVEYHKSALNIIHTVPSGWQPTLMTSLDELLKNLSPSEHQMLDMYIHLVQTILQEVTNGQASRGLGNSGSPVDRRGIEGIVPEEGTGADGANRATGGRRVHHRVPIFVGQGRAVARSAPGRIRRSAVVAFA